MEVGLYFGSFNPIHIGHLIVAQAVLEHSTLQEIWFIVSPQNPLKKNKSLLHEFDRMEMVEQAIRDNDRFKTSDVEFHLPKPSYTIHTLSYLKEKHTQHHFRLIIGEDNLSIFPKWRNFQKILDDFGLIVYPRPGSKKEDQINHPNVSFIDAPLLDISATYVRKSIKEGKSVKYLVPQGALEIIEDKKFYQ